MNNKRKENLISIIVPVYKVEQYLDRCVKSIINQEYRNLEVILVDDGSPDNCPKLCDEWAKKDSRIKVIHKPNGGVSSARNAGLDIASGDYITFVDSDDYISEEFSLCAHKVEDKNIYCFSYYVVNDEKQIKNEPNSAWGGEEIVNDFNDGKVSLTMYNSIWNKIFKASVIKEKNLRFDTNFVMAEDLKFIFDWFKNSQEMNFINIPYYNYFQNPGSVTININYKKIENTLTVCEYGIHLLNDVKDEKTKDFLKKLISENLFSVLKRANDYSKEENEELFKRLKLVKRNFCYGSTFSKKILVILIKLFGLKFTSKIIKVLK